MPVHVIYMIFSVESLPRSGIAAAADFWSDIDTMAAPSRSPKHRHSTSDTSSTCTLASNTFGRGHGSTIRCSTASYIVGMARLR
jgi:hypothetical protein